MAQGRVGRSRESAQSFIGLGKLRADSIRTNRGRMSAENRLRVGPRRVSGFWFLESRPRFALANRSLGKPSACRGVGKRPKLARKLQASQEGALMLRPNLWRVQPHGPLSAHGPCDPHLEACRSRFRLTRMTTRGDLYGFSKWNTLGTGPPYSCLVNADKDSRRGCIVSQGGEWGQCIGRST
jgi:hypothetical protein